MSVKQRALWCLVRARHELDFPKLVGDSLSPDFDRFEPMIRKIVDRIDATIAKIADGTESPDDRA